MCIISGVEMPLAGPLSIFVPKEVVVKHVIVTTMCNDSAWLYFSLSRVNPDGKNDFYLIKRVSCYSATST
jgi:hypothetical protein